MENQKKDKIPIILASASPRRKEICELLGLEFTIQVSENEPLIDISINHEDATLHVAKIKAEDIARLNKNACVIGADTVVINSENVVLGKPKDECHAFEMLCSLQGKNHTVITAVWICHPDPSKTTGFASTAEVVFNSMSEDEIWGYIKTGEPMDKAGSYGIQGIGTRYIQGINGDFYTVMGLPASRLWKTLKSLEII